MGVAWHLYGLAAEGLLHLPDGVTGDGRIIREPYVQGLGLQLLTVDWRTRVRQWPARAHPARAEIALDRGDRVATGKFVDEELRQHLGLRRRGVIVADDRAFHGPQGGHLLQQSHSFFLGEFLAGHGVDRSAIRPHLLAFHLRLLAGSDVLGELRSHLRVIQRPEVGEGEQRGSQRGLLLTLGERGHG